MNNAPAIGGARVMLWVILPLIILASFIVLDLDVGALIAGIPNGASLIAEMFPPDFTRWKQITSLSIETVAIALWGTLIGGLFSFPLGFLAARNTSPSSIVCALSRSFVSLLRSIPEILYALIFVVALGIGPAAGVMALSVGTIGLLSKFYAESVESIDPRPVEAVRATGARGLNCFRHAILPQVFPLFMGYNLYLFDHNIRVAIALGIVGAGGLGIELFTQMRRFQYQRVSAILVIIILLVSAVDRLSAYLRKGIIEGTLFDLHARLKNLLLFAALVTATFMSLLFISVDVKQIGTGFPRILGLMIEAFPPDVSETPLYLRLMLETLAIGICGTAMAIVMSAPLGLLSARNITSNQVLYNLSKELTNLLRAMPELVFALVFVAAVGLGPFAGLMAIGLHTTGFLGKFYSEAIEDLDPSPIEAVDATGARFSQKISHAVMPLMMPLFNSYNLFLLDRNIRASTVMGIVGAGGIGFELIMNTRLFEMQKTATIIIVILVAILGVEWVSAYLRKRVV